MIERGELAGDGERFFVGGGGRGDQADVPGVLRERCKQRHRFEHRRAVGRAVGSKQCRLVHLPHAIAVGQEHHIEFAAFGDLRHLDHAVQLHGGRRKRVPVTPTAEMAAQRTTGEAKHHHAAPRSAVACSGCQRLGASGRAEMAAQGGGLVLLAEKCRGAAVRGRPDRRSR
jgi:hypothetical protein